MTPFFKEKTEEGMDTIAAISTGLTNSGISIIRISGPEAVVLADSVFCAKNEKKKLCEQKTHTIHYGTIQDNGSVIDEVLVSVMRAPHTYTAEDVVEINCHGGIYVTKKVLQTVLQHGARLAEPGEFSKRAFLNGRIDLSKAEAVMEVIHAKNELALRNSIAQLQGRVQKEISSLREKILKRTAFIEAALDDPEHYSLDGFSEELLPECEDVISSIERLVKLSENGRYLREGIKTVILGQPNVGKSSLMNLLSGTERAIVTEIAGTTRDTIEETISVGEITLLLVDTAGLRDTTDQVERIGVERAKKEAEDAELILYLLDATKNPGSSDLIILEQLCEKKIILLNNKTDLCGTKSEEAFVFQDKPVISFSAKTGKGLDELTKQIETMFFDKELTENDELYIAGERQKQALLSAKEAMEQVVSSIKNEMPEDFLTIDLMQCYENLGKITGESVEEDLINTIFKEFCMGK